MRFLLAPVGSAGDVYPFVGLGLALRDRGHEVTLLTSGYFADLVRRVGLDFVDCLPAEDFLASVQHPDLWHPTRGFQHVFQRCLAPHLQRQYDLLRACYSPGTICLSSCLGIGARLLQETEGMPLLTVHLQPAVLWSDYDSPQLGAMPNGPWVPRWLKRAMFDWGCRHFVDGVALPELNRFRTTLQLPPIDSLTRWWNSPEGVLGLFPDWYASVQPDWPAEVCLTTFPRWTADEDQGLPQDVEDFLAEGSPPVIFTPGSAMRFGTSFFRAAQAICERLPGRALFLTRFLDQIATPLPRHILPVAYAPFGLLLKRAAAIVHHGGIGTTSQALAAGIPQLIMPMSHDQPDNACRLRRLGVGDWVTPRWFTPSVVVPRLRRLLHSRQVAQACRTVAQRAAEPDPFQEIYRGIETLLKRRDNANN